jgi:Colicin V production protein
MDIFFPILLVLIFVVAIATLGLEGLWGNALTLVNVVTAALVATNFWEPLAGWLLAKEPRGQYLWDFVSIWGIFILTISLMRLASDSLSRHRVRFPKLLDVIGGYFFAAWVGWVLICFTTFTLHTAPLARGFMAGAFKPEERMFFHLAPDRQWMGFMQKMSQGSFARGASADDPEAHVFDPKGEFMVKYATRRKLFEKNIGLLPSKTGP